MKFPYLADVPLKNYTTFGIGGPARLFASAHTSQEMQQMIAFAHQEGLPLHVLGKGSNCLFDDRGFNGLVILNCIDFLSQKEGEWQVGSGYSFARLGTLTARAGYQGLEFAAGIPATVGGAIYMNAGAGGQETAERLSVVECVTREGDLLRLKKEEMEFGYRTSCFQRLSLVITEAIFVLTSTSGAKERQRELVRARLASQPYKAKSAGCAFRNPPHRSAGRLIEECGLKGYRIGDALVSPLHANFILNEGNATAEQVRTLMGHVKETVYQKKGVLLEEEIQLIHYVPS
jgi:UDP-N-acetylmuramate dehydrogenase